MSWAFQIQILLGENARGVSIEALSKNRHSTILNSNPGKSPWAEPLVCLQYIVLQTNSVAMYLCCLLDLHSKLCLISSFPIFRLREFRVLL